VHETFVIHYFMLSTFVNANSSLAAPATLTVGPRPASRLKGETIVEDPTALAGEQLRFEGVDPC
jgi:hypothetical protein